MPLSDEELNDKFLELATPVLGEAPARSLLAQLWRTESLPNVQYDVQSHSRGAGQPRRTGEVVHGQGEPAV
jgi:hypothetical protein